MIIKHMTQGLDLYDQDYFMALAETREVITRYCHIDRVPWRNPRWNNYSGVRDASFLWCRMASDLVLYDYWRKQERQGGGEGCGQGSIEDNISIDGVTNITLGDSSVAFGANTGTEAGLWKQAHRPNFDDFIMNYKDQLKEYRKLLF